MLRTIKIKAFLVFATIHAGLFLSCFALWKIAEAPPAQKQLFLFLVSGTAAMYGGLLLGVAFLYLPLAPWLRRLQYFLGWRRWILDELPTLIALVPVIAGVVHILRAAWSELKGHHRKGSLDLSHFSKIARRVAEQTEAAMKDGDYSGHAGSRSKAPAGSGRKKHGSLKKAA